MQIVRRPLAQGETDHELVWLLVSFGTFAAAAAWLTLKLPWPICLFHAITGRPCATCGATRAAIAFFHGQFLAALKWNPLAFLIYCAIAFFNAYALVVLIARAPRLRLARLTAAEKNFVRAMAVLLLFANWIYLFVS